MNRPTIRRLLAWLIVAAVAGFAVYKLKFAPVPVVAYTVARGEIVAEVMGAGTLEARVKTTVSARIQERLLEVRVDQGDNHISRRHPPVVLSRREVAAVLAHLEDTWKLAVQLMYGAASVAEIVPQQGVQLQRVGYGDGTALDADQGEATPFCQSAGEGFVDGAELTCQHPLGATETDFGGSISERTRALLEQPVGESRLHVLEGEVIQAADQLAQVQAHGTEHAQRQLGAAAEQVEKRGLGHQQHRRSLHCAGIGGVTAGAVQRPLGERLAGPEHCNDQLLARRADPMHAHRTALDDVKALGGRAFMKQEVALGQSPRYAELRDGVQGFRWQPAKELAGAQGMGIGGVAANLGAGGCHGRFLWDGGGAVKLTKV